MYLRQGGRKIEVQLKTDRGDKAGKASEVVLALRRMKGSEPKAVGKLVLLAANHALLVWYPTATHNVKLLLQLVRRIAA